MGCIMATPAISTLDNKGEEAPQGAPEKSRPSQQPKASKSRMDGGSVEHSISVSQHVLNTGRGSFMGASPAHKPSTLGMGASRPSALSHLSDGFRLDQSSLDAAVTAWFESYGRAADVGSVDGVAKDCRAFFNALAKGEGAGELLSTPIKDPVPADSDKMSVSTSSSIEEEDARTRSRMGIKLEWLAAAFQTLKSSTKRQLVPTRVFVEGFVRPLMLEQGSPDAWTLYDFVPLAYRARPNVFISHPWDGWLKHVLNVPEAVHREWPKDPAVFLDIFNYSQVDAGDPNPEFVSETVKIVKSVGRTYVVLPGDGPTEAALLPLTRSWCVLELLATKPESLQCRVGLHADLGDADFHNRLTQRIKTLSAATSRAHDAHQDKARILQVLGELYPAGLAAADARLQSICRTAFAGRYAAVASPAMKPGETPSGTLGDFYLSE